MIHGCFEVCEVLLIAMNPCYKKLHGKMEKFMKKHAKKGLILNFLLHTIKDVPSAQRTFKKTIT